MCQSGPNGFIANIIGFPHILDIPSYPNSMKETTKIKWKRYALYILIAEAVGGLSGFLTRDAMKLYGEQVIQPPLSPPGWLFPVVWSILYALMGIGAARISLSFPSRERTQALGIYWVQLGVNFLWSIVFFNLQWFGFAFFWLLLLWVLILWMIVSFREIDLPAGNLQIPYLLWVTFAAYLNLGVWILNR